jgi:hypothetical protein
VSIQPSAVRSNAVDATATLGVLVVGAWVLAMTAPLVSAIAVVLAAGLYVPVRRRVVSSSGPAR